MIAVEEITRAGRYRKVEESQNGVSAYEAYDNVRETVVVIREIPMQLSKVTSISRQEALRESFADEAGMLSSIEHPLVQKVYDFYTEVDRHYLVMEPVSGSDMADLLAKKKGAFPLHDIMSWAGQLLDAAHFLHTYAPPVYHRGIRPQNLKLTPEGSIKLLVCSLTVDAHEPRGTEINYLPLEQIWMGLDPASQKVITNSYDERSEKLLMQPADARSDVYSIGATLYHLITGCLPTDPLERSIDMLEGKADPLRSPFMLDAGVPPEISDVIMRAMEIKRENRYDSAVIMRQVLRTALVRVKEREAVEAVKQDEMNAAWEASLAEEMKVEEARRQEAQKQQAIEAERARAEEERRRAEQQQLAAERARAEEAARQAEQQRLAAEAEKARAEEEKRLAEEKEQELAAARAEEERVAREHAAESARVEEERRATEIRRAELEAAEAREAEAIRQRLLEAEEKRVQAEQRAAEAEKRLFDKEIGELVDQESDLAVQAYFEAPLHVTDAPIAAEPEILELPREEFEPRLVEDDKRIELGGMFADAEAPARSGWKVPAAIVGLLVVGGTFFGAWSFLSSKSDTPKTDPVAAISVSNPAPAPSVAPQPAAETPAVTDQNAAQPAAADTRAGQLPAADQPEARNKPVAAQPQAQPAKKPAAAPTKAPETKKKMTVDDLLTDN